MIRVRRGGALIAVALAALLPAELSCRWSPPRRPLDSQLG